MENIPERNQNFWHLTSIQCAAQSIPGVLIGGVLAKQHGPLTAILSIVVGNLILWLIGLAVVTSTMHTKKNTVEIIREYLGKTSSRLIAFILTIAFICWYMLELQAACQTLSPLFKMPTDTTLLFLGGGLGIFTALLSLGGIRWIKWICVGTFPFLLAFILYGILSSHHPVTYEASWTLSLSAVITIVALTLPGTINLPTFFRHSHSRADSILALTLMTLCYILFQIFSIFASVSDPLFFLSALPIPVIVSVLFVLLSLICLNLVNIYYTSASLETFFPHISTKSYLVVGLLGTGGFLWTHNDSIIFFLEHSADNSISSLGISLIISYLVKTIVKHRIRTLEKFVSNAAGMLGCLIALIAQIQLPKDINYPFITGVMGTIVVFLFLLFIEEMLWAWKKLPSFTLWNK